MVNAEKSVAKIKTWGPTCFCLNFMCCQPCLLNFQCF